MSSSNCCFLTCIQVSQEASQVVWYAHLFQNFPQFVVIHTVKGFGIVNKAEIYVFLELSCFFDDPADVGNLISGSSAFSKTSLCVLWCNILFTVDYYHAPDTHFVNFAADNVDLTKRCQKEFFRPGLHMHRQWWLCNNCCLANTNCKIVSIVRYIALLKMLKSERNGHLRTMGIWYYYLIAWRELICVAWIQGFKK